jgi:hypothetical protein
MENQKRTKDIMKRIASAVLLLASPLLALAQPKACAPDQTAVADNVIVSVFQLPAGNDVSTNEHFGRVLGDGLAVAIARKFRLRDLQDPSNAKRVLLLLRYSFSAPEMIMDPAVKKPAVALVLLDYLAEHGSDQDVRLAAKDLADKLEPLRVQADRSVAR